MRIYSIFNSINGEVNHRGQGSWATFIRFAGCNLRCNYCDTQYAQDIEKGQYHSVKEIVHQQIDLQEVLITGGEPLLQIEEFIDLCWQLIANGINITVETNGTYKIPVEVIGRIDWIVDYKLPGSGISDEKFVWENVNLLVNTDFIKFVIVDEVDYQTAKDIVQEIRRRNRYVQIAFSPVMSDKIAGNIGPNQLYQKMQMDGLFDIYLNFQLHKLVKLEEPW